MVKHSQFLVSPPPHSEAEIVQKGVGTYKVLYGISSDMRDISSVYISVWSFGQGGPFGGHKCYIGHNTWFSQILKQVIIYREFLQNTKSIDDSVEKS